MMALVVDARGSVRCVYAEEIDLAALGELRITRASRVEPDETGRWWADVTPAGGPILGPFGHRSQALAAERRWIEEHISSAAAMVTGHPDLACRFRPTHHHTPADNPAAKPEGAEA